MSNFNEIKLKLTIDGKDAVATLQLTDDNVEKLTASLKNASEKGRTVGENMVSSLQNARNAIQGLKEAWSMIGGLFGDQIKMFAIQEQAEIQLAQALKASNRYTEEGFTSLKQYAASLQSITTYGDEAYISLMAQLQAMGLNTKQVKQAALQSANLAAIMGTDLATAGRAMADLFNGNTGQIGRYIKGLEESIIKSGDLDKIMEMLNERIGGQAAALAQTTSGELEQFNNLIGDLREKAGGAVAMGISPLIAHLSDLAQTINAMPEIISGGVGSVGMLTAAFIMLRVTGIGKTITELLRVGPSLASTGIAAASAIPPITGVGTAFRAAGVAAKNFMVSLGPIGWTMIGLSVLLEAANYFNVFSDSADQASNGIDKLNEKFKDVDNSGLKQMIKETNIELDKNRENINRLREEYNRIANADYNTIEKRKMALNTLSLKRAEINERLENQSKLQQLLNDLQSEYNERNKEALALLTSQLEQVKAKIAEGDISSARGKELNRLKENFEKEKEIISRSLEEQIISQDEAKRLQSKLVEQYEAGRAKILKKYYDKNKKERTSALIKELEIEKSHELKMMQLQGVSENELLKKEIEYLNRRKEILANAGESYIQIENLIEEKQAELLIKRNENELKTAERKLELQKKIADKQLELNDASNIQKLENDVQYLKEKLELYRQYGKDAMEIEFELNLKIQELDALRNNEGTASEEYKARLTDELNQSEYLYSEQYRQLEKWKTEELKKYEKDEEAKTLINGVYAKRREEIEKAEAESKKQATMQALSYIAGAYAKHTLVSKLASAAMATINTYEAATKALTAGPIVGPPLAALITAAGLANVAKIMSTETPQATAYEKGGMAIIGEKGPELIAPVSDYAEGQKLLAEKVAASVANTIIMPVNESANGISREFASDLIARLEDWKDRLEFKLSRGDLYAVWEREDKFRKRHQ